MQRENEVKAQLEGCLAIVYKYEAEISTITKQEMEKCNQKTTDLEKSLCLKGASDLDDKYRKGAQQDIENCLKEYPQK